MIDQYKMVMAGRKAPEPDEAKAEAPLHKAPEQDGGLWCEQMEVSPDCSAYGNGSATIMDYCVLDRNQRITNVIPAGEEYTIRMKVQFHKAASDPIFALTVRNKQGTDICGTNTKYENFNTGEIGAGETRVIAFTQRMNHKGGEYLLCLGCTGFSYGEFEVYHRLYDACLIRVVSSKSMVGFFDMNTRIEYTGEGANDG